MSCCIRGCTNNIRTNKEISYHLFPNADRELHRHKEWVKATNNPKLYKLDPMTVMKRYRICRKHFDKDCFNGSCKRLLKTAIPTLHLNNPVQKHKLRSSSSNAVNIPKITEKYSLNLEQIEFDELEYEKNVKIIPYDEILEMEYINAGNENSEFDSPVQDEFTSEDVIEYDVEEEICESLREEETNKSEMNQEKTENDALAQIEEEAIEELNECDYELLDIVHERAPLTEQNFQKWRKDFYECPKNVLAQNVCSRVDPFDVCLSRKALENTQHVFTYKVESEGKPLTNQKNSGRCWIFATLNCIRIPFIKNNNLDEFEFSQAHLFYWDKIERCNYFLHNIVETAQRGEEVNGRLVSFLLNDPTCDGGQWDMIVNLINKYGLMPKKCFPESYNCEASLRLNAVLKSKLREYAKELRDLVADEVAEDDIRAKITSQMGEIYNVVGICLGIPAETFTWEYYDKSKAYHSVGPLKPTEFYDKYVKQHFNVDEKVCLVTDPRPSNPYGQAYTVDCLGNVVGGRPVLYNNQPVELLMDLVTKTIKNGDSVWFGCEVSKRFAGKQGIEDLLVHDFKLVFGVDIQVTMSKADRLLYGESAMTHAMAFTAVSVDDKGEPTKFRVENSWGEDRGEKGYLIMSADWFKEFVFEVVVDKSIVPKDVLKVFNMIPIVLPAWDPMGTLAQN